ncbi:hypothetical protein [Nonomuraea sp. NPDC052265]|uniref:hypothetical protein n=1 Tax=Nonomuraea sp. NPDC052265 TaxID=3364374 RepID=UPI0037CB9C7C
MTRKQFETHPRTVMYAHDNSKEFWRRMIVQEQSRKGGLLTIDEWEKNGFIYAMIVVGHMNGNKGTTWTATRTIAIEGGFSSTSHGMSYQRDILLALGFLTQHGTRRGAPVLSMSFPEALRDIPANKVGHLLYEDLIDGCLAGDLLHTSNTAPKRVEEAHPVPGFQPVEATEGIEKVPALAVDKVASAEAVTPEDNDPGWPDDYDDGFPSIPKPVPTAPEPVRPRRVGFMR